MAPVADGLAQRSARLPHMDAPLGPCRRVVVGGGWLHDPVCSPRNGGTFPAMRTTDIAEPGRTARR